MITKYLLKYGISKTDFEEFLFRALFCIIFVALGGEHLVSDQLIQRLMPEWMPYPRLISMICGLWLICGGGLILLGWHLRWAAYGLGAFLVLVTTLVHLPGVMLTPGQIPADCEWLWTILQRTNLAKNLCLLGVCFHLQNHSLGKLSLERWLSKAEGEKTV